MESQSVANVGWPPSARNVILPRCMGQTIRAHLRGVIAPLAAVVLLTTATTPASAESDRADGAVTFTLVALAGGVAWGLESTLAPSRPRWSTPPEGDRVIHDALKWKHPKAADMASTVLLGAIAASPLLTPLFSEHSYIDTLMLSMQAMAITALVTSAAKLIVARERPRSYYRSRRPSGTSDNLSFFSGHTALAFSAASSVAYLIGREHPDVAPIVWPVAMSAALTVGYLRLASEDHYFSDVVIGAIVGTTAGILVPLLQYDHYFGDDDDDGPSVVLTPFTDGSGAVGFMASGHF